MRRIRSWRLLAGAALLEVAAVACGGDEGEAPQPGQVRAEQAERERDADDEQQGRAAPRWEHVADFDGSGEASETVDIDEEAIQWRLRWQCEGDGRLRIDAAGEGDPLADVACPDDDEAYAADTGMVQLGIEGDGDWRLWVEQQVDTPVHEPPLPEMEAEGARVLAEGQFYEIDRRTQGRALLYQLADGRLAVRIEDLDTVPEPGLYVWVSEATDPQTSQEVLDAPYEQIEHVTATVGDHNYLLPDDITPEQANSLVLWCEPVHIAYGAASLQR